MPFFTQHRKIDIIKLDILARTTKDGDYHLILSVTDANDSLMTSLQIPMPQNAAFVNLQMVSL